MIVLRVLFVAVVVPLLVFFYLPIRLATGSDWTVNIGPLRALGPLLMGLGTLLYFWCVFEPRSDTRGAAAADAAPPRFVARGPYLFVRSPMYIGGLVILVGHALWFEAPALLPYIAVTFAAFHLFILLYEEPRLTRRFGADYREYVDTVPRWIPRSPATSDER